MDDAEVDVLLLTELNVCWQAIPFSHRLSARTANWWGPNMRHVNWSNNKHDGYEDSSQPGGTAILVRGDLSSAVMSSGHDDSGMGRWCWTTFRGKNGLKTTVFSAYRAVPSTGALSTYQQQVRYLRQQLISGCPREVFITDLKQVLETHLSAGEQLVIGIDANDDVRDSALSAMLLGLGFIEAILSRHGPNALATHDNGS